MTDVLKPTASTKTPRTGSNKKATDTTNTDTAQVAGTAAAPSQSDSEPSGLTTHEAIMASLEGVPFVAVFVKAISVDGFWRCGRFWPHEGVQVYAVDDPTTAHAHHDADVFVDMAALERIEHEPLLVVSRLQTDEKEA
ncbi:hypothetical protein [Enterovibrio norvegicus]|uniref:hypothetical protein n=1 Tax=Enterovibrio norvegicus TaxID=188144 RepID=UPI000C843B49|nr:hypothetical protein [Enterovibrio norvegicus]PMN73669.1 hypothetical protein BCT27_01275 [Enterovibrio norvegicus]